MSATTRMQIRKRLNRVMRDLEEIEREVVVYMDNDMPDLVSTQEAAEILGVKPNRVSQLRHRNQFPTPAYDLGCGPVWKREDIELFQSMRGGT